jgi:peptidoglycan hydrolase CwlO-like protein
MYFREYLCVTVLFVMNFREYLSKLEAEKREQEALFASLKSQLRLEKEEKEKLKSR